MALILISKVTMHFNIVNYNRVTGLKVDPTNIAIPTSLITEDGEGQLQFTVYIQVADGFLSKKQLEVALMVTLLGLYCLEAAFIIVVVLFPS